MLLYHFPLNTQENIENFTNKGIKDDIEFANSEQMVVATEGCISQTSLYNTKYTNGWYRFKCNGLNHQKGSLCFRLKLDNSYLVNLSTCCQFFGEENDGGMFRYYTSSVNRLQDGGLKITENSFDGWKNFVFNYEVINNVLIGKWYVDGVLTLTRDNYANTYIESISFGGRWTYNATQNLKYYIQDIRIYDYALSQAEINEYSRALVVHYPLQGNELNPSVLKDVSGFGNDMQRYGGSSSYDNNSPRADKSLHLVNANHCYYQGDMKWSDFSKFTISAWIYPTSTSNYRGVIGMHAVTGGVCFAQFVSGNLRFAMITSNNVNVFFYQVDAISTNKWWHVVMSYDGSKGYVYINGELRYSANISSTPNFAHSVVIGKAFESNDRYWDGNISDVRIYATALSSEDIKNLYNSPIAVSKQHQTMAFEFNENPLYPSKYWRTPTYSEIRYILLTRVNAANLYTLGRVEISSGVYRNGLFLLPDDWVLPVGLSMVITTANYTSNSYSLTDFAILENAGAVFLPSGGRRNGVTLENQLASENWTSTFVAGQTLYGWNFMVDINTHRVGTAWKQRFYGNSVRLCKPGSRFSVSPASKIDFAPANLQYHCTQHIWRFAQHSYDIIGAANVNISDYYNGWIDLFGYGTSGINYSPTLHTKTNSDYASGDISNTDNDWGVNEIQSYDYNVKNFAANKNGIVQHNELRENDSDVNGCYNDKLITNELIEQ